MCPFPSKIPIQLRLHCIMKSDVPDGLTNSQTLNEFTRRGTSYDKWNGLRMSADTTILLVDRYEDTANCGSNYFWALKTGKNLGTISLDCEYK